MSTQIHELPVRTRLAEKRQVQTRTPSRRWKTAYGLALIGTDAVMLAVAFFLAFWIRFVLQVSISPEVVPSTRFYSQLMLVLIPTWIVLFLLHGLYDLDSLLGGIKEYARVFNACSVGMMLVVVTAFVEPTFVVARGWSASAWVLSIFFVCSSRFVLRRAIYALREKGLLLTPAVVAGSNGEARSLAAQLLAEPRSGIDVIGIVEAASNNNHKDLALDGSQLPVLGRTSEMAAIVSRYYIEKVIVAASSMDREELLGIFEQVQPFPHVSMDLSTGLYEVLTTGVQPKTTGTVPLIGLNRLRLSPLQFAAKTALDYLVASTAILLLLPVFAGLALLIRFDSLGPVIYRRRVMGVGGQTFDAFKFRTMRTDGQELLQQHPDLAKKLETEGKLRQDPRVTALGTFLRRYSLDELPQFFNVLQGNMSLVGPRMITTAESNKYGCHKANLLTVKPGITGLWQVSGRSELTYDERVRLDMHYIRNYSLWLDFQILFIRTPSAVFKGRGAY